jgi:hypothetical protein
MPGINTGEFGRFRIIFDSPDIARSKPAGVDVDSLDLNHQKTIRYNQDTKERKRLATWVRWVVSLWLIFTAFTIAVNHILCFNLSDTVMCMLLGTTTANILGLAFIVIKGTF